MKRLKKTFAILFLLVSLIKLSNAQKIELTKVEPEFWWVGMKNPELMLLVYGKDISYSKVSVNYLGVELKEVVSVENPHYLFLYLHISPSAQAGKFPIKFQFGKQEKIFTYELKNRKKSPLDYAGFTSADMMYLLMPDRFANGNEANDNIAGMKDSANRQDKYGRHGGDLQGIMNHLDYIADLGATAIWINPVLENNQPKHSYHGYAITDLYKVDARYGTNDDYEKLVEMCHQKGLKVVMDMVFNHIGNEHWFFKDMPMRDWVHQFPQFTRSNYRLAVALDPYSSQSDSDLMVKGWFDTHMPDLNQHNKFLGTYLIQNSIWWIERVGLDGIRMDTHPYPYKDFMARWLAEVMNEYPNFNIVGEVWESKVIVEAYWQTNASNRDGYKGNLPSITDFPLCFALNDAFNEKDEWEKGVAKIYYTLVQDILYPNAMNNLIFLDNHDISRFATVINKDVQKMKMGLACLATLRGIPQLFYGTEVMMEGPGNDHGALRGDFPGGWKNDAKNVFTGRGISQEENEVLQYTRKLFNWRKRKTVIHSGKLMHFVPDDGVYVFFRYDEKETVMVVLNNKNENRTLSTKRFAERMKDYTSATNIITNENLSDLEKITLPAKSATILELKK